MFCTPDVEEDTELLITRINDKLMAHLIDINILVGGSHASLIEEGLRAVTQRYFNEIKSESFHK
jgi:hypothetical protein